jgi:hypothetical protein
MDLFEHAKLRRDAGMATAAAAQDEETPGFTELAYQHIVELARSNPTVHIDQFLSTFTLKPSHPNAFGAPWQRAKRNKIIVPSGEALPCTVDSKKNAHLYPVYRSLIYAV